MCASLAPFLLGFSLLLQSPPQAEEGTGGQTAQSPFLQRRGRGQTARGPFLQRRGTWGADGPGSIPVEEGTGGQMARGPFLQRRGHGGQTAQGSFLQRRGQGADGPGSIPAFLAGGPGAEQVTPSPELRVPCGKAEQDVDPPARAVAGIDEILGRPGSCTADGYPQADVGQGATGRV